MNAWKRLTREESKEVTRMRTHRSSREVFTRKGFDDASVEEISETTGYSPFSCSSAVPAAEVVRLVYSWTRHSSQNIRSACSAMLAEVVGRSLSPLDVVMLGRQM